MRQIDLRVKNIVLAGVFNPAIFDKYFFIKNQLINDNEIQNNSIFGNITGAQVITTRIHIAITINQIIVTDLQPKENDEFINNFINSFIKAGKIINITALGINFHWFLHDNSKNLSQLSREYFYDEKIAILSTSFNTVDAQFGINASKSVGKARLNFDAKPIIINVFNAPKIDTQNVINCSFNFHFDIKNKENNSEVLGHLKDYGHYMKESKNIISIYE